MTHLLSRYRLVLVCLALALGTLAVYGPVTHHEFFNIDDPAFICQNPRVQAGLSLESIQWAFQSIDTGNWQPLTWLSHMFDCRIYGLHAGGHHLTSLLFHIANSLLVFLWLNRLTRAFWRSAFVAAFFAWHPLHVESVAWACERKDVLSAFFWLLALLAYTRYACALSPAAPSDPIRWTGRPALYYALTLVFFACGLMSKPMVVTLPCVLLLLDFWPLDRLGLTSRFKTPPAPDRIRAAVHLLMEKVPFFLLALAVGILTLFAQHTGGAVASLDKLPLAVRAANSLLSCLAYFAQSFWPSGLACFYPYDFVPPANLVFSAVILLFAGTAFSIWRVRQEPYLLVGWLWFLGVLLPVIGLVHVGIQARADRYMYLPSIGLFLAVVWGLHGLVSRWPGGLRLSAALGALALLGCVAVTSRQVGYWQNSLTLSAHAIEVTRNNYVAYESLARALWESGRKEEAVKCYRKAIQIQPDFAPARYNLGLALRESGQSAEAVEQLEAAVKLAPNRHESRAALGATLLLMDGSRLAEAVAQLSAALRLNPNSAETHYNLALAMIREGDLAGARRLLASAVRLAPANPAFHFYLAQILEQQGDFPAAVTQFQAALRLAPDFPGASASLKRLGAGHPPLDNPAPAGLAH